MLPFALVATLALGGTFANAAVIVGTNGKDYLEGTHRADRIYGKAGNDVIDGRGSPDRIHGGSGNDVLYGGKDIGGTRCALRPRW
jgi:Ca2+-binding RTX toxin-like protein